MTQTQTISPLGDVAVAVGPPAPLPEPVGRWQPVALVAEGNLARIWRARPADSSPEQPAAYALKMLRPEWQDDPQAVALLAREAVAGRSVSHPHLVPILAANVSRPPRFLVMPWLDGYTLRDRLRGGRPLDLPEALWIVRQAAEALAALHGADWMHGDVKPSNVFLSTEGHATLVDLGFARRVDETGSAVDRCVLGTFHYLAPETLVSTLRTDIRSDIYSFGVMLFEMLTGRLPFEGKDLTELATQHRQAAPPELRRLAPRLPGEVVQLVRAMIAKEPLRRPQTPGELVDRLVDLEIASFTERAWA